MTTEPALNIVLVNPEIPPNTGNIGRTCVGLGAMLHLIEPLGYSLEEKEIKRSGLDYWPKLNFRTYSDWNAFEKILPPTADLCFFSARSKVSFWEKKYAAPVFLVFGPESRGLDPSFHERFKNQMFRIPVKDEIRSLNLGTAAGIAAFEVARQLRIVQ